MQNLLMGKNRCWRILINRFITCFVFFHIPVSLLKSFNAVFDVFILICRLATHGKRFRKLADPLPDIVCMVLGEITNNVISRSKC